MSSVFPNWHWLTVRLAPHRLNLSSLRSLSGLRAGPAAGEAQGDGAGDGEHRLRGPPQS